MVIHLRTGAFPMKLLLTCDLHFNLVWFDWLERRQHISILPRTRNRLRRTRIPRGKKGNKKTFALEYDTARKIAQGLGAHLEDLRHVVEVAGETAHLLHVAERIA